MELLERQSLDHVSGGYDAVAIERPEGYCRFPSGALRQTITELQGCAAAPDGGCRR